MATILKSQDRDFQEDPGKIDNFRLFSGFCHNPAVAAGISFFLLFAVCEKHYASDPGGPEICRGDFKGSKP